MKILVTGGAGRLARVLLPAFAPAHDVVATDCGERPEHLPPEVVYEQADLRDADRMAALAAGAEVVVHLGAISGRAGHIPQTDLHAVNVQGAFNVLDAAARAGARTTILASSICAIGLPDGFTGHGLAYLPLDEAYPCRPRHTYDLSKRLNEISAETVTRLSGMTTVCFRFPLLTNVRTDAWFAERLRRDPPQLVMGDYLDNRDAVTAIELAMLRKDLTHEVLFVHAATAALSVSTVEHLRRFSPTVPWHGESPGATTPLVRTDRARRVLGFEPAITWQQGVADVPE